MRGQPAGIFEFDAFVYFPEPMTKALLTSAFQQISLDETFGASALATAIQLWRSFCTSVLIVPVEGETPSPAESGHVVSRLVRDTLGLPETNIKPAKEALYLLKQGMQKPVVFIDDFSGTGLQFRDFWRRSYQLVDSTATSFQRLEMQGYGPFYFTPLVMTHTAGEMISRIASTVRLRPAHLIGKEYYAVSNESLLWPPGSTAEGLDFLRRAAVRLGLDPRDQSALLGHGQMGLALAFSHGAPDTTLPIFSWALNGFVPLLSRS